jgi:PST family polysaccharide transporter
VALALFVSAPDLILLLYGERWQASAPLLRVLALVFLARPLWENAGTILTAVGKPQITTRVTLLWLGIFAAIGLPFTLLWGVQGTSVAVGIAAFLGLGIMLRALMANVPMDIRATLLWTGVLTGATLLIYYVGWTGLRPLTHAPLALRVFGQVGSIVVLYYGLSLLLRPRDSLDRLRYIRRLVNRN